MLIKPGTSIGSVQFDMNPEQVRVLMGEPEVHEEWMGGNLNDSLLYHGMVLGFDRCDHSGPLRDSRFVEARIFGREDAELWGKRFHDWNKEDVLNQLKRSQVSHDALQNGDVLVPALGVSLGFDDNSKLTHLDMWKVQSN
jgi:hypothetical protein